MEDTFFSKHDCQISVRNHIYIGDNYQTLIAAELECYHGKVDFIYIDPPYNTHNAFSYNDSNNKWEYDIFVRLQEAKKYLSDSGVIFISIDDSELSCLINIGCKVFGQNNYVGLFVTKQSLRSNAKYINTIHEYILCFAKNKKILPKFYVHRMVNPQDSVLLKKIISNTKQNMHISKEYALKELKKYILNYTEKTGQTWIKNYSSIDDYGNIFFGKDLSTPGAPCSVDIDEINLHLKPLKTRGWSSPEKFIRLYKENRLTYKSNRPYEIEYLTEATDNVTSILDFYSRQGTNELKKLGFDGLFDTPKPVELIKFLIRCSQHKDSLIMDFYAGSGTTAQAVYEVNAEDNTNHRFILMQLDEKMNPKAEPYKIMQKLGYKHPTVSDAMLLRIKTFLEKSHLPIDYEIHKRIYESKDANNQALISMVSLIS